MTSCAPTRAFRTAGMKAHAAPASDASDQHRRDDQEPRQPFEQDPQPRGGESAHEQLALGADVEEVGAEAVCDRQPREDQRRGAHERLADLIRVAQRAVVQRGERREGIVPGDRHDDRAGDHGQQHADQRRADLLRHDHPSPALGGDLLRRRHERHPPRPRSRPPRRPRRAPRRRPSCTRPASRRPSPPRRTRRRCDPRT